MFNKIHYLLNQHLKLKKVYLSETDRAQNHIAIIFRYKVRDYKK
jgi:hypothetical protein